MENGKPIIPESKKVKEKLDEILENHFRKLDQINVIRSDINLSMASVASLHLIVEREIEVEEGGTPLIERYTRKAFLNDLTELGLEIDDDLMVVFQKLIDNEYFRVDSQGFYHAELLSREMVAHFNKMFPGMPGMNLVAYVIQTLDEIMSGRKDNSKGFSQFDQALSSRGRPLTFVHLKTVKKTEQQLAEDRIKRAKEREESRKASEQLKKINSAKLAKFRGVMLESSEQPQLVTKRAIGANEINIKEISPRKIQEAKEKEEKERLERERIELENLKLEQEKLERERLEAERLAREQEEKEQLERERMEQEQEEERLKQEEQERFEKEREEEERLVREKELEEKLELERIEKERLKNELLEKERIEKELAIEAQIAEFEQGNATTCPLCHKGVIVHDSTDSGKEYYKCNSEGCRFISWSKPHNFSCPICNNPYLMEYPLPGGAAGLKCPLAACSYMQNNLFNPVQQVEAQQPMMPPGNGLAMPQGQVPAPKKRRLVRKKKR